MDKPNKLQGRINSVGAMAEMTTLYRKGLLNQGISPNKAIKYTAAFVAATLGGGKSGQA